MSFKSLIGQNELRSLLLRALEKNRLSHAVLLSGPSGSGKKAWGRALAMSILCLEPSGGEPCMACPSCRSFINGNHTNYFSIAPDGRNIKIEQIRSIRQGFYLQGGKKVCLIDGAETMTAEASSSLLKILEDPPAGVHFVLLAEQLRLLFDTIISRCQRYTLKPLSFSEATGLLLEHKNISAEKAALLARLSGGLPGCAFRLADDGQFEERCEEAKTLAYNLATGCDSARQLLSWALYLSEKKDLVSFLELLCMQYRDGLVQSLGREGATAWFSNAGSAALEDAIMLINKVIYEMNTTNVNRRLLMEKTLILLQRRLSTCRKSSESGLNRPARPTTLNPV